MRFKGQVRITARGWRCLAFACGLMFLLMLWRSHFRVTIVVGESMLPTFKTGDLLLVDRRAYRNEDPHRGDIVVARYRQELVVKRIVGLPREEVEVKAGALFVNNTLMAADHATKQGFLYIGKGKLFAGKFAILGDNRAFPVSQIVHAIVSKEQIIGKVVFSIRLWPPTPPLPVLPSAVKNTKPQRTHRGKAAT